VLLILLLGEGSAKRIIRSLDNKAYKLASQNNREIVTMEMRTIRWVILKPLLTISQSKYKPRQ
jgi:hypothetical protein